MYTIWSSFLLETKKKINVKQYLHSYQWANVTAINGQWYHAKPMQMQMFSLFQCVILFGVSHYFAKEICHENEFHILCAQLKQTSNKKTRRKKAQEKTHN